MAWEPPCSQLTKPRQLHRQPKIERLAAAAAAAIVRVKGPAATAAQAAVGGAMLVVQHSTAQANRSR
eukprot:scaffold241321_cov19-Tisochrysis_lutea.AAC.3